MNVKRLAVLAAALGGFGLAASAKAAAIPFSTSTFTLNHSTVEDQDSKDVPTVLSTSSLRLTTVGAGSDANTAFFTTAESLTTPFTVTFTYQDTPTPGLFGANGITFVIAGTGTTANGNPTTQIGGRGSGLGYGNNDSSRTNNFVANSVATELALYPTSAGANSTGIVTGGATQASVAAGNFVASGLNLASDPINVVLTFNGTSETELLTDTTTNTTFTQTVPVSLASVVGSTGFIGFTAGSGGTTSTQVVSNLTFTPVPEPTSLGLVGVGAMGLLARRRRTV